MGTTGVEVKWLPERAARLTLHLYSNVTLAEVGRAPASPGLRWLAAIQDFPDYLCRSGSLHGPIHLATNTTMCTAPGFLPSSSSAQDNLSQLYHLTNREPHILHFRSGRVILAFVDGSIQGTTVTGEAVPPVYLTCISRHTAATWYWANLLHRWSV